MQFFFNSKIIVLAGTVVVFFLFSCKKTPVSNPLVPSVAVAPASDTIPADPSVAGTIGFFMDNWQAENFAIPSGTVEQPLTTNKATVTVTVNTGQVITKIAPNYLGNNSNVWCGQLNTKSTLVNFQPGILRGPAGSVSDVFFFNANNNTAPAGAPPVLVNGTGVQSPAGYWYGKKNESWTFSTYGYYNLLQQTNCIGLLTLNYGYARYGTGLNTVAAAAHLAADWVRYDRGRRKYWEVGNECFGDSEAGYRINTATNQDGQPEILTKNKKVLVAGPSAQSISALNGCWSYTWQGKEEQWYPADSKTIYQAIADKVGAANVVSTTGKGFDNPLNFDVTALTNAAANADVIVLCIGEDAYAESPGNTRELALDNNQVVLASAAFLSGKPVILVLTEGRPRFITNIAAPAKGILMAYWSGKKTAEAVADVLFGDYNPDGILPFSYPRSMGEIVLYDRKPSEDIREVFNDDIHTGYDPLFPFGHGLSYTTFEYGDIQLGASSLNGDEKLTVTVSVKNTGSKDGKHTVELYSHDRYASITPNMKRLRPFKKIFLKAGETQTVNFTIDKNDLAFVNAQLKTVTEPGAFELMIGKKKATFNYQ